MEFASPYENDEVAPEEMLSANFARILGDEQYQSGAYERYSPDEQLEPFKLVSEDAVYRENQETPALFISDVGADALENTGQGVKGVIRLTFYQMLSEPDGPEATAALSRQAFRRNYAVSKMALYAPRGEVFRGMNVGGRAKVVVTRREPSVNVPGQASYRRWPSTTVEVRMMEGA